LEQKAVPLTLSTTNPTWTGLESNLGLCDEGTVVNHINHDMGKITYQNCCAFLSAGSHKRQMKLIFSKGTLMEKEVVLNYCNIQEFSIRVREDFFLHWYHLSEFDVIQLVSLNM
jgi:hypothetical protein